MTDPMPGAQPWQSTGRHPEVRGPVERVGLSRSFHVATLDHDAPLSGQRAVDLVTRVAA